MAPSGAIFLSMDTFYGFKLGQSQDYDSVGRRWPITMVKVEPMIVVNNRQVAFGHKKTLSKPLTGLLKNLPFDSVQGKPEKISPKYIREMNFENKPVGEKITISDVFNSGDKVKVTGTTKGKGFQGVVRRHGFAGGPKTHGQSDRLRHPGSIGQTTTPGRVYKGKRMAGHMGNTQTTVPNLEIFAVKPEENLLLIKGLVPGGRNTFLRIKKA